MTSYNDTLTESLASTETGSQQTLRLPNALIETLDLASPDSAQLTIPVTVLGGATFNITSPVTETPIRNDVLVESLNIEEINTTFLPIQAVITEALNMTSPASGQKVTNAVLTELPAMTDSAVAHLTVVITFTEALNLQEVFSHKLTLNQVLAETLGITVVVSDGFETYVGWIMNSETAAHAMWDNFGFNSLATNDDGLAFGAMSDGIYVLDGSDDAGEDILYSLRTGKMEFGDPRAKGIPKVLLGGITDGKLFLKVIQDDGQEWVYTSRQVRDGEDVVEFKPGRGIRSRYLQFELFNQETSALELSSIEFFPLIMTRQR